MANLATDGGPTPQGKALLAAVEAAELATEHAHTFAHPAYRRAERLFENIKREHGADLLALAVTLSGGLPLVSGRNESVQKTLGYRR